MGVVVNSYSMIFFTGEVSLYCGLASDQASPPLRTTGIDTALRAVTVAGLV